MKKQLFELKESLDNIGERFASKMIFDIIKISQDSTYAIKPGDSYSKISGGDTQYQKLIEEANPDIDPTKLRVGQKIILPPKPIRNNQSMKPSQRIISFIKKHEGYSQAGLPYLEPYNDGFGNITIGWGHNYGKVDINSVSEISMAEAEKLFQEDLAEAVGFVRRNVKPKLTQGQFDAMVSITFNAGLGRLYSSDLFKRIDAGEFDEAVRMIPRSLIGEGQGGLASRRAQEAAIFSS